MNNGTRFSGLIDTAGLQALLDNFNQVIGTANAVIDVEGTVIAGSGWQDVCAKYHRVNPATCGRCIESDTSLVKNKLKESSFAVYDCPNGLIDTAAPVVIDGQHVANVVSGQFFTVPPNLDFFRKQAHEFGFDEKSYLEAVGRVPVIARERVEAITRLYANIAHMLATEGMSHLRKQAEDRLKLAASVFTHAREGIVITDAEGSIVEVNDAFTGITGYSREETLGKNPRMLKSGNQGPEFYAAMWRDLTSMGYWAGEIWNRRKNGEMYAEMITISAVCDAEGKTQHYVALFTDITLKKEQQQQLEHTAHYDTLTNLPNRVLLADRLQQAMIQSQRRNQSLAVVYLDLDGFKVVNDTHSHDAGDKLLVAVSQRMKAVLRECDTLARIGGDEFVAVLVDLNQPQDCEPALERLLCAAAKPVMVDDAVLNVSASIGVALYPQDGKDADLLMRHADQAMYAAKQSGKNRYHLFDAVYDTAVRAQRESLEHIRRALDRHEFVLHYQPKVNMTTGAVVGAEALIRWQHPERGLLLPADFLPIIEKQPVSVELGEWVIDTALAQMREWHALGLDIPVSVNIGARQLQQKDFVKRLSALLAKYPDVQPGSLELEVLEAVTLEGMADISAVMHACREMGVRFALDNFGTGNSSLAYLKHLPADVLKIDLSFVRDMFVDPDDLSVINGAISLATAFRRQVIAEGVETISHGIQLIAMGCDLAQGYGVSRSMPAAAMPGWVASWRPDAAWAA